MLSIDGIPLFAPSARLCEWIEANMAPANLPTLTTPDWDSSPWSGVFPPEATKLPGPVRVNELIWPIHASRFACARFLATSGQVRAILDGNSGMDETQPRPARLEIESTSTPGASRISAEMFLLPPSPPQFMDIAGGLHLLTLVDSRYFWRDRPMLPRKIDRTTTWEGLLTALAGDLGTTIDLEPVGAEHLSPSGIINRMIGEPACMILDSVAASIGRRIVRRHDGTLERFTLDRSGIRNVRTTRGCSPE
jgi:hypothetical protein